MQIVLSNSIVGSDVSVINNIVSAVFQANNTSVSSFEPSKSLFISNNTEDKADFYIDIADFVSDNRSFKMIVFKNLAEKVFGTYVDPRAIIGNYETLSNGNPAPVIEPVIEPVAAPAETPVVPIVTVEQIEKIEEELEVIKQEITSTIVPAIPTPVSGNAEQETVKSTISRSFFA